MADELFAKQHNLKDVLQQYCYLKRLFGIKCVIENTVCGCKLRNHESG